MYIAVLCLITLTAVQVTPGPLPKLRNRVPKWVRLEPIKIMRNSDEAQTYRKFDSIVHFDTEQKNELFGDANVIYLTKGVDKHPNNLLNIIEQLTEDTEPPVDQEYQDTDLVEALLRMKRGLRRLGTEGLPVKMTYDFNELVN